MSRYRIVMADDFMREHPDVEDKEQAQTMADILNLLYLYQKVWGFDEAGLNTEQIEAGVQWIAKVRETGK